MDESFGAALRRLRERSGLTQEELAERARLSVRAISALERGQRRHPYPHTVRALTSALELNPADGTALQATITPRNRRHVPPVDSGSLIGRAADLDALAGLVTAGSTRLVTVTGPGGVGKTRLALALAARVREQFPDGVAFVSLAAVPEPDLVVPTIARCLDVRESGTESQVLHRYLHRHRMLLVLDNLEHLLPAGPEIAAILAAAPRVQVLATSRAPLRLRDEQVYPLTPLEPGDAAKLFAVRATQVAPHRDPAEPRVVAEICQRLDGLPLAIELAAARANVLAPAALLTRLDKPLSVLTDGARDLPERQRALDRTVAWSHDLLDPAEQQLFGQLGAFHGGWALDDAAAITELDQPAALRLHSGLVDSSLVVPREDVGEPRFQMLETIRDYAAQRLAESQHGPAIRARHAAHYHQVLLRGAKQIWSPAQLVWSDRLNLDRSNVRDALAWHLERDDHEAIADACFALCMVGWAGVPFDQEELLADAAGKHETALSQIGRAKLLFTQVCLRAPKGNLDGATEALTTATDLLRDAGDLDTLAWTMVFLGALHGLEGRAQESVRSLTEAATLGRRLGIPDVVVRATMMLARLDFVAGRLAEADRRLVGCAAEVGDSAAPWSLGSIPVLRGRIAYELGDLARAEDLLRSAAVTMGRLGDRDCLGVALLYLAAVALQRSAGDTAARLLGATDTLVERGVFVLRPFDYPVDQHCRRAAREQLGEDAFDRHYRDGFALPYDEVVALAKD